MYHSGVLKEDTYPWWQARPFDLSTDAEDFGNCILCLMMSEWKIKERMMLLALREQIKLRPGAPMPASVAQWVGYEERISDRPGPFRRDRPNYRALWEAVCRGEMQGSRVDDVCQACTD